MCLVDRSKSEQPKSMILRVCAGHRLAIFQLPAEGW